MKKENMIRPYTKKEEKLLREGLKQTEPFLLTKEMLVKKDKQEFPTSHLNKNDPVVKQLIKERFKKNG
jgi:hypothetical protein